MTVKLRGELVSLYTADTGRRVFTESVLPWLFNFFKQRKRAAASARAKKNDDDGGDVGVGDGDTSNAALVEEYSKDEYEGFDDYLEMVIELGYVVLFAAAFPLAAPLSVLCNVVEIRSDAFKLYKNCRRPHCVRAKNIGPWMGILQATIWVSAITNVLVMGLTSEQLKTAFPALFADLGRTHAARKGGVELMVAMEHALLAAGLAITFAVRKEPAWVRDDVARRGFEKTRAMMRELTRVRRERSASRLKSRSTSELVK